MEAPPRLLDFALLEELEKRLRDQGAPAIASANPGLSEDEMQAAVSSIGLRLPVEARVWWAWRDGVAPELGASARAIGPRRQWLPLGEAVQECVRIRRMKAEAWRDAPDEAEAQWSRTWLPMVASEAPVVIETDVPEGAPSPVWAHLFAERPGPPHLPSIGELVGVWIDAIDRGAWRRAGGRWICDKESLEPWVAKLDLA